ncbi:NADH dehydrogenase I chain G [Salmonella enterica subsp. enterica]|uniref:NADH dehydrogenase I chain G n=1 Tax=Salmonella enterica I TaxID=59201 RepID=A0A3S4LWA6_SALET|nr:NADH dehydrogenase I chain G [Salmonella enterica subsp. enterica]
MEDQARLGFAIAHALDNTAPAVDGIDSDLQNKIDVIVQALAGAKKPLIISGTNAGSSEVISGGRQRGESAERPWRRTSVLL